MPKPSWLVDVSSGVVKVGDEDIRDLSTGVEGNLLSERHGQLMWIVDMSDKRTKKPSREEESEHRRKRKMKRRRQERRSRGELSDR